MVRIYLAIYDLEWNIETQRIQQQDNTLAISPNQSCVAALEWHDCRINQQLHNQNLLKLPTIGLGSIGITLENEGQFPHDVDLHSKYVNKSSFWSTVFSRTFDYLFFT